MAASQPDQELCVEVRPDEAGQRLDRFLAVHFPGISRSRIQRALRRDGATVDGVAAWKTGLSLRAGQEVQFALPPLDPIRALPEDLPLTVLYEDDSLVVVNKAAGMVVHPAAGHPGGTLVNALLHRYPEMTRLGEMRPGIVHRLDKGTSGVIVIARTARARERLAEQFLERTVCKGYLAVVLGTPREPSARLEAPIDRHPTRRKEFTSRTGTGRHATTLYTTCAAGGGAALLAVRILTGRTHQIRVHLADAGHPVVADETYGSHWRKALRISASGHPELAAGPLLHASLLRLVHPVTDDTMTFVAPLPDRFTPLCERLFPGIVESLQQPGGIEPRLFPGGEAP